MRRAIRQRVAAVLGVAPLALGAPAAGVGTERFEHAFSSAGEPARLHARILFRTESGVRHMEMWRDGDRRIKRVTDAALISLATHRPGDPGYKLLLVDTRRRIATTIERTNLYRIGAFTDWYDLGHALRHPKADYHLVTAAVPSGSLPAAPRPCRWYDLTQNARVTHICWDAVDRFPVLMAGADGALLWRVTSLDTGPILDNVFDVDTRGYVHANADRDINPD